MYDITIVGAGPAGAALARLIGKKYKVLLLDRRNLTSSICYSSEKCCGGLLAPDSQKMLAKLGLGVPKDVLVGPQLFTVRTIDMDNSIEKYYQRHYINVDREKFDKWLVSLIPNCVTIKYNSLFKSFTKEQDKIKINYVQNGTTITEYTKILIGADGAHSMVRNQIDNNHISPKQYIAIQEWFKVNEPLPYYSAIFDKEITDFYSWTIPKEDILILGAALIPNDKPHTRFELLKNKLLKYGFKFEKSIKQNGAFIYRTEKLNQIYLGKENTALIGEAAGWISPSSAEGLSYAFKSAIAVAESLDHGVDNFIKHYHNNTSHMRLNILGKNLKSPAMYNKSVRKMVMNSGLMSMKIQETE